MFKITPIAALVAALMSSTALAADKGGYATCCADLEERVAELEATAAHKGNRKMSLTVYGQVNWGILHYDADGFDEDEGGEETTITNNSNSVTRFGFKGQAKISPEASAGFLLEIGTGVAKPMFRKKGWWDYEVATDGVLGTELGIRHSAVYLQHNQLGSVWLGQTSTATDGIAEISIARVANASTLLSLEPVSGAWLGGMNLPFDGGRAEVVKWVSPTVGGFTASAAWMGNEDEAWDAALRYAGEFGGFQFAAGVGYRDEKSPVPWGDEVKTWTGSASVMHTTTGLFGNVAAGKVEGIASNGNVGLKNSYFVFDDAKAVHVQGGIERNWFGPGRTALYGEWARYESADVEQSDFWGLGINQAIDAAAMDLYVGYRNYDVGDQKPESELQSVNIGGSVIIAGGIIHF